MYTLFFPLVQKVVMVILAFFVLPLFLIGIQDRHTPTLGDTINHVLLPNRNLDIDMHRAEGHKVRLINDYSVVEVANVPGVHLRYNDLPGGEQYSTDILQTKSSEIFEPSKCPDVFSAPAAPQALSNGRRCEAIAEPTPFHGAIFVSTSRSGSDFSELFFNIDQTFIAVRHNDTVTYERFLSLLETLEPTPTQSIDAYIATNKAAINQINSSIELRAQ